MRAFLSNHRNDLISRFKAKVARRPTRRATAAQLAHGIPMFLDQLTRTLAAEERGELEESLMNPELPAATRQRLPRWALAPRRMPGPSPLLRSGPKGSAHRTAR